METDKRLDMLNWFVNRSDTFRASYRNRASILVTADTLIMATIVFLSDKVFGEAAGFREAPARYFLMAALLSMGVSFVLSLLACATLSRSSRRATQFQGPPRYFYNDKDTFDEAREEFSRYEKLFSEMTEASLIQSGCAELWVGQKLQRKRYNYLKVATLLLFVSVFSVLVAWSFVYIIYP
jgi:hypothetical protein